MAVRGTRVSVTSGAAPILTDQAFSVVIKNSDSTNAVDLGDISVTYGTGFNLPAGASVSIDLEPGGNIYAVSSGPTVILQILEMVP